MDRNFFLAFILSSLVIFGYYSIYPPAKPKPETEVVDQDKPAETVQEALPEVTLPVAKDKELPPPLPDNSTVERETITVDTPLYALEIDSRGAVLDNFYLKNYKYSSTPHVSITKLISKLIFGGKEKKQQPVDMERLVNMVAEKTIENRVWEFSINDRTLPTNYRSPVNNLQIQGGTKRLSLSAVLPSGLEVVKELTFYPDSYLIDMDIRVVNRTGGTQSLHPRLNFGSANEEIVQEKRPTAKLGITSIDDDFETYDDGDFEERLKLKNMSWSGVMSTYFESVVRTRGDFTLQGEFVPLKSTLQEKDIVVPKFEYTDQEINLANGKEYRRSFQLYIGPKVQSEMDKFHKTLYESLDLGVFDFLAYPILGILRWLDEKTENWGVAIIILTLIVRLALFPMAYKGMISMKRMSTLNPQIKKLREKYKDNKEKLNAEIMAFYKRNKVNPVGGCLPMMMQIPVFFALYSALLPAIELRHQPFIFWLDDLSAADYTLVLPLIMGASMFLQQHLTPSPTMDPNQARIMKWMPVMMIFFFLDMPSGLVLYWAVSNIFTIIQQLVFNKVRQPEVQN